MIQQITKKVNPKSGKSATQIIKRIGSTTYVVNVHFSKNGKQRIEDKILRLLESEVRKIA